MSEAPHVTSVPASGEQSLGALVAAASRDLSALIKMEKELAIAELTQTVKRIVPAAAGLIVAAVAGFFVLVIGSMALAYGIGDFLTVGWGFGIVTLIWLLLAAVGGLVGHALDQEDLRPRADHPYRQGDRRLGPPPDQQHQRLDGRHPLSRRLFCVRLGACL